MTLLQKNKRHSIKNRVRYKLIVSSKRKKKKTSWWEKKIYDDKAHWHMEVTFKKKKI